jgi:hypothetical protein
MALLMDLAVVLAGLNAALLLGLIYIYGRIVRHRKATYVVGLLVFALFLLIHNLMTVYSYLLMTPFFGEAVLPYLFIVALFEFGGLLALFRVTL